MLDYRSVASFHSGWFSTSMIVGERVPFLISIIDGKWSSHEGLWTVSKRKCPYKSFPYKAEETSYLLTNRVTQPTRTMCKTDPRLCGGSCSAELWGPRLQVQLPWKVSGNIITTIIFNIIINKIPSWKNTAEATCINIYSAYQQTSLTTCCQFPRTTMYHYLAAKTRFGKNTLPPPPKKHTPNHL